MNPDPELTTARLTLVPLRPDRSDAHDERECRLADEHWSEHGFGSWALLEPGGGLAGVAEVHFAHPGVEGISTDEIEVGWSIVERCRGRGLATEAMRAAIADLWTRTGATHVVAYIRPGNAASHRVARKLGLRRRARRPVALGRSGGRLRAPTLPVTTVAQEVATAPRKGPTLGAFLALGLFWGGWAAVLPSVQTATHTSKGTLGVALLFITLAAIPAMLFVAGPLVDRFGLRAVTITTAAFAAATTLPGLATSLPGLIAALAVTGAATGAMDVAMNASAARIEAVTGKRLMPLAHGLFSVGVLLGAVAAGLARGAGSGREPILLAIAVLVGLIALWTATDSGPVSPPGARELRFSRAIVLIGLIGAAAFVVEGGIESWSALFLERQLHAQPAISGLGPGFYGAAMAAGRFFGQGTRLGDRTLLTGGAAVAAAGCLVAATAPSAPVALAGFVLGGLGVSLNAPIVFGAAGRRSASALSTVTTLGYVGLLLGPPLIGGVAQASSLRVSFAVLAVVAAAALVAASRLRLD